MMRSPALLVRLLAVACLCAPWAQDAAASAATVSVTVTITVTDTGVSSAPEETVVVFDPLDAIVPPKATTAIIDQVNKRFMPRVSVLRTGTAVSFPNSDRILHQVYSFSPPHPFTLKLYAGAPQVNEVLDKPGMVILGCNIHDKMVAFVAVVDTPYFAKLPPSGNAQFNLPPGRYRLRVWHPRLKAPFEPRQITVGSEPLLLPLQVELDSSRDAAAPWPD